MAFGMPTLLVGNLTSDPELKNAQSGKAYVRLTVATTPRVKNRQTNAYEDGPPSFISVTLYDALAENVAASLSKGNRVIAYGSLEKRVWMDTSTNQEREGLQLEDVTAFGADLRFARASIARAGAGGGGGQQRAVAQQNGQQYGQPQQQYGQPQYGQQPPQQAFVQQGPPTALQQPAGYPAPQQAPQQPQQAPQQGYPPQQPVAGYDPNFAGGSPYADDTPF